MPASPNMIVVYREPITKCEDEPSKPEFAETTWTVDVCGREELVMDGRIDAT